MVYAKNLQPRGRGFETQHRILNGCYVDCFTRENPIETPWIACYSQLIGLESKKLIKIPSWLCNKILEEINHHVLGLSLVRLPKCPKFIFASFKNFGTYVDVDAAENLLILRQQFVSKIIQTFF